MTSPGQDLQGTYPPNTNMRIGIARNIGGGVIQVEVSGSIVNVAYLDPIIGTDEVPVALLRTGATWLCLGRIVDTPPT